METVLAAEGTNNNGCVLVLVMRSVCVLLYIVQSVRACVRGVFEILRNTLFLIRHLFVPMERENGGERGRGKEGKGDRWGREAGKGSRWGSEELREEEGGVNVYILRELAKNAFLSHRLSDCCGDEENNPW